MSEHAFLSVICRDDLKTCAVLWIGTLTGGPVQGESPPVLVKKSQIITYSRTSVCGRTYLGVVYRKKHIY